MTTTTVAAETLHASATTVVYARDLVRICGRGDTSVRALDGATAPSPSTETQPPPSRSGS